MLWAHMPAQRCVYARAASICWHGEPIDQTLTPDDRRSVPRPLSAHRRCATSRQLSTTYGAALTPPRTKSSTHSPCRERRSSRAEALAGSHVAAHCRACAWQAPSMTCTMRPTPSKASAHPAPGCHGQTAGASHRRACMDGTSRHRLARLRLYQQRPPLELCVMRGLATRASSSHGTDGPRAYLAAFLSWVNFFLHWSLEREPTTAATFSHRFSEPSG